VAGALDGHGADRITWSRPKTGGVRVEAWRGEGPQRLWEVTFDHWYPGFDGTWLVTNLDGDRCADLVVQTEDRLVALSGATGKPLWTWGGSELDPLVVTARKQHARTC
jgi:hypothetical protein